MVVLDGTILNVALLHVRNALGFSHSNLAWVVNVYALVFGGGLLLGGRSGDLLGRALASGFSQGFLVCAAIGLLALIIALAAIRVTREDLSGVDPLAARAD